MKKMGLAALGWCFLASATASAAIMIPGDFYLISRGDDGLFAGSHKIFQRESSGLRRVSYCGRNYWVRPVTVAWTQVEVENRKEVRVEFNMGKGWRPICEKPEKQVTLKDLGVTQDARVVLSTNGQDLDGINRFSAIRDSFQTGNKSKKSSYHD
ncbi:hypothetical protein [Labrenzia sp. CE80]|uniref:hypothetical protein n=1 Tax=Labrenzia sp. CE80 TaxID=1788986 RepID=UPI001AD90204|nr:hypothetical protein [Labrenzia sp. CE80]